MKSPTLININHSQKEYLELLLQYKADIQADDLSVTRICALLDEVKCFWLKQLKSIELELAELAESQTCFALSGAIFLNVSDNEHYFFKSLGDCHIIPDPFSRLEMFFRHSQEAINVAFTVDYFKQAFFDTLEILTTYTGHFYILPIREIAVEDPEKHRELLDMFFWRFISNAFDDEFKNHEDFHEKYKNFEEIEAGLNSYVRKHLVFNDLGEIDLSLRERVEKYSGQYTNIASDFEVKSDVSMFLLAVFSYIAQVADILYVCSVLRINPYIRFDITFTYFTLVMNVFIEDENLRNMIEKTLVSHIFYKITDGSSFESISFFEYCKRVEEKSLLNSILEKMKDKEIHIFEDDTSKIVQIIKEEFDGIL